MADRRMFHKKVVESDPFYQLSEGAQAIYMHLCMNADDDGFVNNANGITNQFKGGPSKLSQLVERRFVLKFGDVYVIKHWRIGNSLKNDRMKLPTYPNIAAKIWIKPNRSYTDHSQEGCPTLMDVKTGIQMESKRNPSGIQMESQKNRTDSEENRTDSEENRIEPNRCADADIDRMYLSYPKHRRGDKLSVSEMFMLEIRSQSDLETAMKNLEEWKRSEQWTSDGGQYIPLLANWLDRGIWRTRPPKKGIPMGASGELGEAEMEAIRRILAEQSVEQEANDAN